MHAESKYEDKVNAIKNMQNRYMGIPTEKGEKYL